MVTHSDTRYAHSSDLSIAYREVGSGPRDILFIPGFISNVDLMSEIPWIAHNLGRLARLGRVVYFDKRGTGVSDRSLGAGSAEDRMDDIRAVVDAAGVERAAVVGLSEGGPLALLFAAAYPDRVSSLTLWGTMARSLVASDYPIGITPEQMVSKLAGVKFHNGFESTVGQGTRFVVGLPTTGDRGPR